MKRFATFAIWAASLAVLLLGGTLATPFVMMPLSLDFGDLLAGGAEPWREAAYAGGAFTVLAIAVVLGLWLWHRGRLFAAWTFAAGEAVAVGWCGWVVYRDFF